MRHPPLCGRLAWLAWLLLAISIFVTIKFRKSDKAKKHYLATCNSIFPNYPCTPMQRYHAVNCTVLTLSQTNTTVTLLLRTTQVPFIRQDTTIPIAEYHNLTMCYSNIYTGITLIIPDPCMSAGHLSNTKAAITALFIIYMIINGWTIIALGYISDSYEDDIAYRSRI